MRTTMKPLPAPGDRRAPRNPVRRAQRPFNSELVALLDPVEPVFYRLPGFLIGIDHFELGERNRQTLLIPVHLDEHIVLAILYGSHADDLDLFSHLQRRGGSFGSTPGEEGEVELPFKVVVPAYSSFFFVVGIDDGLHGDPALSYLVRFDLGSSKPLNHRKSLHLSGFSPHTINTAVRVHNLCNVGGCRLVFLRNTSKPEAREGAAV